MHPSSYYRRAKAALNNKFYRALNLKTPYHHLLSNITYSPGFVNAFQPQIVPHSFMQAIQGLKLPFESLICMESYSAGEGFSAVQLFGSLP